MAPAGGFAQIDAAISAGADAVFFGVNPSEAARSGGAGFHARAKVGIPEEALPELMAKLHTNGVLGFVTFNILVFDRELKKAEKSLIALAEAGVDAIIVQDHGVARLAHEICPDLHIHGSTQMSITSAAGAELAARFGARRVVLGRELSLEDIARIRSQTNLELETFVHGALCVSYSGQCFSSEAWGGRSANRGQCAQACRLPYEMWVDGVHKDLGDARYLLSPGDLYALHQVPDLVNIGVNCLKIEGRYKDAEFVAATTAAYRKAVDAAWAGYRAVFSPQEEQDLAQVYSRGLGPHFISGINHQTVVRGRAPRHRGVEVGKVLGITERGVLVELKLRVRAGDGLVFDPANWRTPEGREEGGFVYGLWKDGVQLSPERIEKMPATPKDGFSEVVEIRFARGAIDAARVKAGDPVWRTADPSLGARLQGRIQAKQSPISAHFWAKVGEVPRLTLSENGQEVTVLAEAPASEAKNRALDENAVWEQLEKLGGTPFCLQELHCEIEGAVFLPVSALNKLRREATEALLQRRSAPPERSATPRLQSTLQRLGTPAEADEAPPQLHALVRRAEQLQAIIDMPPAERPDSVTIDYLELNGLRPSVLQAKAAGLAVRVATPRILKPGEDNLQRFLLGLNADLLVRSGGLLESLQTLPHEELSGDFSLNAANVLTARALLGMGLARLTPTHDLNAQQVAEWAELVGADRVEAIAFQHLPVFHTEHCVFCRFLSNGTNFTNCGHPCERHSVALQDERGVQHPVMADAGCRNTVFEGRPQIAAQWLELWRLAGIRHFRVEFVHQSPAEVAAVVRLHKRFLQEEMTAAELAIALGELSKQGTTEGSLWVPKDFGALDPLPMLS